MPHANPHCYAVGIDEADIDFMGHVNNASYLKWVQAAVLNHWQRLAPADAVRNHLWVALKHEITYRRPAFLDDEVVAAVLLENVQGARAFYQTIINVARKCLPRSDRVGAASMRKRIALPVLRVILSIVSYRGRP